MKRFLLILFLVQLMDIKVETGRIPHYEKTLVRLRSHFYTKLQTVRPVYLGFLFCVRFPMTRSDRCKGPFFHHGSGVLSWGPPEGVGVFLGYESSCPLPCILLFYFELKVPLIPKENYLESYDLNISLSSSSMRD